MAIDAYPFNVSQTEEFKTRALTVSFSVDNRGLPEITALSSANHQLGSSSVINIQGNNLSVVTKVYLEHFGDESFINPNSLELSSSEFQIINDQQIDIFVPGIRVYFPLIIELSCRRFSDRQFDIYADHISPRNFCSKLFQYSSWT